MKFSAVLLAAVAVADDKKVPDRTPEMRLNSLVKFSNEILTDWFGFMTDNRKAAWITKFENHGFRMNRAFKRCGFYDPSLPHGGPAPARKRREVDEEERYNRDDPSEGIKQITTGFSKWAQRYIAACGNQRNDLVIKKRMTKWNDQLQAQLANQGPP